MTRLSAPRRSRLWTGAVVLALAALAAWINLPLVSRVFDRSSARVAALPAATPFRAGQRVLMLSPHPDDETLCCAGMIQQAQAAGAQVSIAWMTAGDGFEFDAALTERTLRPGPQNMRALGDTRVGEARRAAAVLGVPAQRTYMLGYPDGGLFRLFTTNFTVPYTAPRTRADAVYVTGALTPDAPFTGQALEADLTRVLDRVQPDVVLAPAPQDFHTDHHTLSYIALQLMSRRHQADRLRYWVVHGGLEWPVPKGLHEALPLTVPPLANRLPWTRVDLTPEQRGRKLEAVRAYRTQTEIEPRFMEAFVRANELLSPEPLPTAGPAADAPPE
ncbi:LmbE family N-acetylglucosaminyl deacetylase [Deinococcus metalli]|uniref:LmbE family N-acetylglucosaminyl deacetylase n=1 Tax=Deinococcus metalli TaxID=1141878 RepID=A0A7W8KAP8_9DEIO|nr:PIG-L deacetylase family protein [Deinococcus metalli]MBB5374762.1 LmbE family N-acetylglucosaminyl deacetylase [Deinococcus metalli]GHF33906.1 PIG-L domain-containing protein [Deinococcus metalli]